MYAYIPPDGTEPCQPSESPAGQLFLLPAYFFCVSATLRVVGSEWKNRLRSSTAWRQHTWAYVSIREHTWAYVSRLRGCTAWRQHTSAHVSTRQHTSAYVSRLRGSTAVLVFMCIVVCGRWICSSMRTLDMWYSINTLRMRDMLQAHAHVAGACWICGSINTLRMRGMLQAHAHVAGACAGATAAHVVLALCGSIHTLRMRGMLQAHAQAQQQLMSSWRHIGYTSSLRPHTLAA